MWDKPKTQHLEIGFNGEKLKGLYDVIDVRTAAERNADNEIGLLSGPVIVFLTGHGQRPSDAWKFSYDLAQKSKSGIVVVPVCDTPCGHNKAWHGDRGKDVVLMEMVRHLLGEKGIYLKGYMPLSDQPIRVNGQYAPNRDRGIPAKLAVIGWSHGGLLARRMASLYPETVTDLGQVCPAGYKKWEYGGLSLLLRFTAECSRTGSMLFSKKAPDAAGAALGFCMGIMGDSVRGFLSALQGLKPLRMFRAIRDLKDCAIHGDGSNFPLRDIGHIVVIFARGDTLFDHSQVGVKDPIDPSKEEIISFWENFYPSVKVDGERHTLRFLMGNHLAPISYHDQYAKAVLEGINQLGDMETLG